MAGADARYANNAAAVFSLKYPVAWCRNCRRPVLTDRVERGRAKLVHEAASRDMKVHALEGLPDHVHLFIETDPRWAPTEFAGKIKANEGRYGRYRQEA
jgi:putative transposase